MVPEAPLERTENGAFPYEDGWFVVNARDAQWFESGGLGFYAPFEGENAMFGELGINLNVLRLGEPSASTTRRRRRRTSSCSRASAC